MAATIVAGNVTAEAEAYLREHGATIESVAPLTIISLPEDAQICVPGHQGIENEHSIEWPGEEGRDPEAWIVVYLELDAYETRITLERAKTVQPYEAPALTIYQDEAEQLNTFYSGIEA